MFNINFSGLIQLLLPSSWRKFKMVAWIKLILSHLKNVYESFFSLRSAWLYDINFTGQVVYLEKKLNDTFSCEGIYISDVDFSPLLYLYNKGEDYLPVFFYNLWVIGVFYNTGDWIIYQNYMYEYTGIGNGASPDTDPNANNRGEIETFIGEYGIDAVDFDFAVFIPSDVFAGLTDDDILKLKKTVEYYKLAEMRYTLKIY